MLSHLLTLIGLAFFIKIFFDGAKNLIIGKDGDLVKNKTFYIHAALAIIFIVVARIITKV